MASIVASVKRQEGLSLVLKTQPVVGLLTLTGFVDDATPNDANDTFVKTFRYTVDGVNYSPWTPLSVPNIQAISLPTNAIFIAELNYFKSQPAGATYLNVTTATISGTAAASPSEAQYFQNSVFSRYFGSTDPEVLNWFINVLEKLYDKGLVPNYIDRKDANGSSEDYLAIWGAVAKFFSYYVKLARTFSQFWNNEFLIREFLKQRGLHTSPEDTLADLQYMLQTFFAQMTQRGTVNIVKDKTELINTDGELLRLINHKRLIDEFMFCLYRKHHFGWNVGNSSPLHKGLRINDELNKVPWSKRTVGMDFAAPYITGAGSVVDNTDGIKVAKFTGNGVLAWSSADNVKVDPRLDYQISFRIKLTGKMSLQLLGYDTNNNLVINTSRKTGASTNAFFSNAVLSRTDKYLTVKCYLYNKDRGVFGSDVLNIRQGGNLIANNSLAKMGLALTITGTAEIYDFRVQPMQTDYSRGFVQSNNFISTWIVNRNGEYTIRQLEDYVSRYLIPYNTHLKITNIGDVMYTAIQEDIDTTYWVGSGEYCRKVLWIGTNPSCEVVSYSWIPEEETSYCEQQ